MTIRDRELPAAIVASSEDAIIAKTLAGVVLPWLLAATATQVPA